MHSLKKNHPTSTTDRLVGDESCLGDEKAPAISIGRAILAIPLSIRPMARVLTFKPSCGNKSRYPAARGCLQIHDAQAPPGKHRAG